MSTLTASIQWHCEHAGTVRFHPGGGSWTGYADYDQSLGIVWRRPGVVALEGLDKPLSRERWEAVVRAVCAVPGARYMEREAPGGRRRKTLDLDIWRGRLGV